MKNLKKISFVIAFLAIVSVSYAQFNWGIKAGFNASTIMGGSSSDTEGFDKKYKPGFHVGVAAQYMFSQAAGIETGLYYSMLGSVEEYKLSDENGTLKIKETANPSYLQIPLAFIYKFNVGQDLYLYPSIGIYAGYGIGGKYKGEVTASGLYKDFIDEYGYYNEDADFFGDDSGTNRFDLGGTIGLNLQYSKFTIGLGYDYGFLKINKESMYEVDEFGNNGAKIDDLKNGNIKVSIGYFF